MKSQLLAACAVVMGLASGMSFGQGATAWPSRPVTIVSYSPGASGDFDARAWGQRLQETLGRPFLLDFKAGAAGIIASNYVAKSAPDGHTLLMVAGSFTVNPATRPDLPYDTIKDFTHLSLLLRRVTVLLVHPSLPINTFTEYMAYVKANPEQLNFGTNGPGAITHMMSAWLHSLAGLKVTFIHYKGTAPMFQDLAAGRVQVTSGSVFTSSPFVKSGKARPIALLGKDRSNLMPGMRTAAEQGVPDYDYSTWTGLIGPAGMSTDVVNKLAGEIARIAKSPDMIAQFAKDGTLVIGSSPADFRKFVISEITTMKRVAQEFNIKAADE